MIGGMKGPETKVLQLAITDGCDSHCVYCNFWRNKDPTHFRLENLERLFSVIGGESLELICITGGEPTEHPEVEKMIRKVSDISRQKVLLSSNCLDYDRLERIIGGVGDRIHTISTSLDGCEEDHDRNRGVRGAYSNVMRARNLARKNDIQIKFAITVVEGNLKDVPRLLEEYTDESLDVKTASLSSAYYGNNTEKVNLIRQKTPIHSALFGHLREYYLGHDVKNLYTFYNGLFVKHGIRPVCTTGLTELFVFSNGDLYACHSKSKLANFKEVSKGKLDALRSEFHNTHSKCNECFARCSSSILQVLPEHYGRIAEEIVGRWRKGESAPELEYLQQIRGPKD